MAGVKILLWLEVPVIEGLYKISKVLILINKGCNCIKHIGIIYC